MGQQIFIEITQFLMRLPCRWGIETSFCSDINILCLEEFSGQSLKSIEQDFQVTSFFLNLQRLIKNNANQRLKK